MARSPKGSAFNPNDWTRPNAPSRRGGGGGVRFVCVFFFGYANKWHVLEIYIFLYGMYNLYMLCICIYIYILNINIDMKELHMNKDIYE